MRICNSHFNQIDPKVCSKFLRMWKISCVSTYFINSLLCTFKHNQKYYNTANKGEAGISKHL